MTSLSEIFKGLDSGAAALFGALIGAGGALVGQMLTGLGKAWYESAAFQRLNHKERINQITEVYKYAVDAIYRIKDGKVNSVEERAKVTSAVRFFGSKEVNQLIDQYFLHQEGFDEKTVIDAMQRHLEDLNLKFVWFPLRIIRWLKNYLVD
jgi:hypothetical protein